MNVCYPLASVIPPAMILVLCVVAGIATVLMLPSRFEPSIRKIGGAIMIAVGLILAAMLARGAQGAGINVYFWIFSAIAIVSALRRPSPRATSREPAGSRIPARDLSRKR